MTEWGIDTLFNPGKRHMDEEKRRLQSTREEIGDSSGGKRIDLESGVVRIARPKQSESEDAGSEDAESGEVAEFEDAESEDAGSEDAESGEVADEDSASDEPADATDSDSDAIATDSDAAAEKQS